ncbi:MAG: hypothetical protein AAF063_36680 [Cyanobacteria bacterium J06643_5]
MPEAALLYFERRMVVSGAKKSLNVQFSPLGTVSPELAAAEAEFNKVSNGGSILRKSEE